MYNTIMHNIYIVTCGIFMYNFLHFCITLYVLPKYDYQYIKNVGINIISNYGYNILYGISCCQIYGIKMYKIINPSITFMQKQLLVVKDELLMLFAYKDKPCVTHIDYYNNGIMVCSGCTNISPHQLTKDHVETFNNFTYDYMVIQHKPSHNDVQVDKLCLQYYPTSTNINWVKSNIKFLLLQLNYNDTEHYIHLSTNEYNYYIQNAIIDKQFINYYLQHVLQQNTIDKDDKYTLHVVDNDVKFHTLTESDSIIINKDDYIIKIGNDN